MTDGGGSATRSGAARAYGRLVRLSLLPSALADAVCGVVLGAGGWPGSRALLALVVSACLFHGGMALNDWADREEDARLDRDRPLPSGRIAPSAALALVVVLFVVAVATAASVAPAAGYAAAAVALLAAVYDLVGRGPLKGPVLLGLCRAGNLTAAAFVGAAVAGVALEPWLLIAPAVAYAAYVFTLSRMGRMEDDTEQEPGARPRPLLGVLAVLLGLAPLIAAGAQALVQEPSYDVWHVASVLVGVVLAGRGAGALVAEARAHQNWTRGEVMAAMGIALRRLALFTCAVTFGLGEPLAGAAILLVYPLGARLRRAFPPS